MKRKRNVPGPRRRSGRILPLLLILSAGMGFLAGLYFAAHTPDTATRLTEHISIAADHSKSALRGLWERLQGEKTAVPRSRASISDTGHGGDQLQLFFAPVRAHYGRQVDEALIELIGNGRERIVCAFYDFELEHIAEALIERHNAGVSVSIVSDSDYRKQPGIRRCIAAGIPVVFDERSALMHNKFCVVDNRFVWTGSTNITHNCMYRNNNNALLIDSPQLAVNFTTEFEEMFIHRLFGAGSPANTTYPVVYVADKRVECYFAPEDGVEAAVLAALSEAQASIDFKAFVFTSQPIAEAMAARMAVGARVRGVLERRSAGSRHSRHTFLRDNGAEIYIDTGARTMHHKVIVVDAQVVMTGSYNFSANAEQRNDENMLIIHCPEIAGRYLEEMALIIQEL